MGQSASRESGNKIYAPKAPLSLSPDLSKDLEENLDTDFTRSQQLSKDVEDLVAARLYQARVDADSKLAQVKSNLVTPEDDDERSSLKLREKLQALSKELSARPRHGELDRAANAARSLLVQCITENKERVLDCREQFLAFQSEVERRDKTAA